MSGFEVNHVRVGVSHRLPLIGAGVAGALSRYPGMDVAEVFLQERAAFARHKEYDVIVLDYDSGMEYLASRGDGNSRLSSRQIPKLLILASQDRESDVRFALAAGADGFVLIGCQLDELHASVMSLSRGVKYLGSDVAVRLADSISREPLTQRETDVLELIVKGWSNKLIARELDIALGTVKAHAKAVYGKLGVASRLQAMNIASKRGLLPVVRTPDSIARRGLHGFGAGIWNGAETAVPGLHAIAFSE